jgi:hypothetical protein
MKTVWRPRAPLHQQPPSPNVTARSLAVYSGARCRRSKSKKGQLFTGYTWSPIGREPQAYSTDRTTGLPAHGRHRDRHTRPAGTDSNT